MAVAAAWGARAPQGTPEGVENNGSITRVGTFPIGIDPERFARALETDEVQSHVAKLLNRYAGRKVRVWGGFGARVWVLRARDGRGAEPHGQAAQPLRRSQG